MRRVTPAGLALIKQFEGFSPTVYICPAGYPTIGYGHVVKLQERERFASGITPEQARSTLRRKVNRGDHAAVPAEFRKWVWAGGRRLEGLILRREAEIIRYQLV
ncbi:MAG: lysozyme [Holosporales bacterium]|jgi:lysozyme